MTEILPQIVEMVEEVEGCRPYLNYSGRGMFGRRCFGIQVGGQEGPLAVFGRLLQASDDYCADEREQIIEQLAELLVDARIDALGLDTIVYFPRFTCPDEG